MTALVRAEFAPEPFPLLLLERLQAFNVSLLSIMNCSGRIFAGLTSDYLKHNYGLQRSVFLVLSSVLFILGCFLISFNSTSTYVVWCTSILGFSYGCLFGIGPVLTSELFGLENFSSNWGFMVSQISVDMSHLLIQASLLHQVYLGISLIFCMAKSTICIQTRSPMNAAKAWLVIEVRLLPPL